MHRYRDIWNKNFEIKHVQKACETIFDITLKDDVYLHLTIYQMFVLSTKINKFYVVINKGFILYYMLNNKCFCCNMMFCLRILCFIS